MKRSLALLILALSVLAFDVALKAYVHFQIPMMTWSSPIYPYGGIGVFHDWHGVDFSINHIMNKGAAWGTFASLHQYLLYVRLVIIGGMLTYLLFFCRVLGKQVPLTLIAAGAIGNVLDHFFYGHVVDMFLFRFWGYVFPLFNIADSAITCGIAYLLLQGLFQKRKTSSKATRSA